MPGEAQKPEAIDQVKVLGGGGYGIGILHRGYRGLRLMGGLQNKAGGVGVQCVLGI